MALKLKYESKTLGVTFDEAYARITGIEYNADNKDIRVDFSVYAASSAREREQVLSKLHEKLGEATEAHLLAERAYHDTGLKADTIRGIAAETKDKKKEDIESEAAQVVEADKKHQEALAKLFTAKKTADALRDGLNQEPSVTCLSHLHFTFPYNDARVKERGLLGYAYDCLKDAKDLKSPQDV